MDLPRPSRSHVELCRDGRGSARLRASTSPTHYRVSGDAEGAPFRTANIWDIALSTAVVVHSIGENLTFGTRRGR